MKDTLERDELQATKQKWLKPSEIKKRGLIVDITGKPNYRHILRLIHRGELKAKVWAKQGQKPYYVVHVDEIYRYNKWWNSQEPDDYNS